MCDGSTKWQEIEHLRRVFRVNRYPEAVIKGTLEADPHRPTPPKPVRHSSNCCSSQSRSTLRSALVHVKQPSEDREKKVAVYEVPCQDCECVYTGETSRTLESA